MYDINKQLDKLFIMFRDEIWEDDRSRSTYASKNSRLMIAFDDWVKGLSNTELAEYMESDEDFILKETRKRVEMAFYSFFDWRKN